MMNSPYSNDELIKTHQTLRDALAFSDNAKDDIQYKIARDACIQRFEYCIELAWKISMKALGSTTKFPKPAIREMARANLIDSAEMWLGFIEARNNTSHAYDEDVAKRVFAEIQKFSPQLDGLIERLENLK